MSYKIETMYHFPIVIPDASLTQDGVMTRAQVAQLNAASGTTLTSVKTADYSANIDETVRLDPTGGGFYITMPPLGNPGHDVAIVNVTGSANPVVIRGAIAQQLSVPGSINAGTNSLNIIDINPFVIGAAITVAGAGVAGADLHTTITGTGLGTLILFDNASTSVVGAIVTSIGRQSINNGVAIDSNAAYRAIVLRDCGTLWVKMSQV